MCRQNYSRYLSLPAAVLVFALAFVGMSGSENGLVGAAVAEESIATLRGGAIPSQDEVNSIPRVSNKDLRRMRNYPEQPPTIPHSTRGYQVTKNSNKCMSCHSRRGAEQSQAPMVSVTHFMDREGQVLTSVSPRRFFCTQCHVTQAEIKPLVGNTFLDVSSVLKTLSGKQGD